MTVLRVLAKPVTDKRVYSMMTVLLEYIDSLKWLAKSVIH